MPDRNYLPLAPTPHPDGAWRTWRKKGEPPVEIRSFLECLRHAGRGGIRAGALGYLLRVGINLALLSTKVRRIPRHLRVETVRRALLGETPRQLASSLGTFVFLYRLVYNSFPLLLSPHWDPVPQANSAGPTRTGGDRLFHDLESAKEELAKYLRTSTRARGWFSLMAGSIAAGIAIKSVDAGLQSGIAQQSFVRGLLISYNVAAEKHRFRIPHGALILWVISCAQICYGFTMRPDSLSHGYRTWISKSIMIPPQTVSINDSLVREATMRVGLLDEVIALPYIHPENKTDLLERRRMATLPTPDCGSRYVPCAVLHAGVRGCWNVPLKKFPKMMRGVLPMYAAVHLIPTLLFRSKTFLKDPLRVLLKTVWKTSRSALFVSVLIHSYEGLLCSKHWLYETLHRMDSLPPWAADMFISGPSFGLIGLIAGLALVIEDQRRHTELVMYILPKAMESAWTIAGGSKHLRKATSINGEVIMAAVGVGMIMKAYQCDPQHMPGIIGQVLYQLVGPN